MKHINRLKTATAAMLMLSLGNAAYGGHGAQRAGQTTGEQFAIQARVVDVEPLVRIVQVTVPQEVCWQEPVQQRASRYESATPKVVGGILGGVVGNKFGSGRGNTIMTVAGALLGASVGRDVANRRSQQQSAYMRYEQVCEFEQVTHEEERTDGYRVTYEYGGREFVTYTDVEPGRFIQVRVHLEPVAYNPASTLSPAGDLLAPYRYRYHS